MGPQGPDGERVRSTGMGGRGKGGMGGRGKGGMGGRGKGGMGGRGKGFTNK